MWEILSNELKYLFYTKRWLLYLHVITHALFTNASFEISMLTLQVLSFPNFLDSLSDSNFSH